MSIDICKDSKIYVAATAAIATGGPELLHQLVYRLRSDLSLDAFMYYLPTDHAKPVHEAYKEYGNPFVKSIDDREQNVLIVPEVYSLASVLTKFKNIRKILWWLSVDNFYTSMYIHRHWTNLPIRGINKLARMLRINQPFDLSRVALYAYRKYNLRGIPFLDNIYLHLVQSEYARCHLIKKGVKNIAYLSDYLNKNFLETRTDLSKKENVVVYNPRKGIKFTRKILRAAPKINFVPIMGMNRDEVIEVLQRAKVYIDFGNHPGKDRLPREAAILNCCVITSKRGSAQYFEDIPIPQEYKFEDKERNIPNIIKKIEDSFVNFEQNNEHFEHYREVIKAEPRKFVNDLERIFKLRK